MCILYRDAFLKNVDLYSIVSCVFYIAMVFERTLTCTPSSRVYFISRCYALHLLIVTRVRQLCMSAVLTNTASVLFIHHRSRPDKTNTKPIITMCPCCCYYTVSSSSPSLSLLLSLLLLLFHFETYIRGDVDNCIVSFLRDSLIAPASPTLLSHSDSPLPP